MLPDDIRQQLQHIANGTVLAAATDHCAAIRNFLCASYRTSQSVKSDFEGQLVIKKEQAERLKKYADEHHLLVTQLPDNYHTRGGESRIYLDSNAKQVIKINDADYYATWLECFNSVVLHNLFFPATAYTFEGFAEFEGELHSVVRQQYIPSDELASLNMIGELLISNGFVHDRRHDTIIPPTVSCWKTCMMKMFCSTRILSSLSILFYIPWIRRNTRSTNKQSSA